MLIDVSRLVWRRLAGRRPTGIDRVCLEYVRHFGGCAEARALFHWRRVRWVIPAFISRRLFRWLLDGEALVVSAAPLPAASLFIGHTGLQWSGFAEWVRRALPPAVVFVHDLIPLTHPSLCRPGQDKVHARRMREALRAAHGVVVNSRHTSDELAAFAASEGMALPPVCVAPLAPGVGARSMARVGPPPGQPYFLVVGTVEARKNHGLLLDLWVRWTAERGPADSPPVLVVVGQAGWEADVTLQRLQQDNAPWVWYRDADDETVAWYVQHALALLMPSLAEGYGMPVAEALALGTPVICSDLPALREVGGDVPEYLPPEDSEAWIDALRRYAMLPVSASRDAQRQRLLDWRTPTWQSHFECVGEFLRAQGAAQP